MRTRLDLRKELLAVLVSLGIREEDGDGHLYFQPPESVKMTYPAIVYSLRNIEIRHADNVPYMLTKRYAVTAIDKDPESGLPDLIAQIPTASFDRFYTADKLNHWAFTLHGS